MKGIIIFLLVPFFAQAKFEAPRRMTSGRTDFLTRAIWESCYSITNSSTAIGLPCNPAFLESVPEEKVFLQAFASNNVKYFHDAYDVIMYKASTSTVRRLFSQSRDARFEGDLEIHYQKDNWAVGFSPSRLSYYTIVRNQVLPFISLYASNEQVLRGQMSWDWNSEIKVGLQARAVMRAFILSEFFATDAVVEDSNVLRRHYQNSIFLEPGVVWSPSQLAMETQISATVTQLGISNHHYAGIPDRPEGEIGFSVRPETKAGTLRIGPHLSFNEQNPQIKDQLRLSGIYEIEKLKYLASISKSELDVAAFVQRNDLSAGVVVVL